MTQSVRPQVAVVILNFFKAARVVEALAALRRQSCASSLELIVVDNSANREQEAILRAGTTAADKLIINAGNVGYSKGINIGAAAASNYDFVLLANPDIVVDDESAIERLLAVMAERPDIGVLSPLQINDDGTPVEVARSFPSLFRQIARRVVAGSFEEYDLLGPLRGGAPTSSVSVDWIQSSFVLVRADVWQKAKGLDERYFVFMADVELCHQARDHGYDVVVSAAAQVRADGLRASRGGPLSLLRKKIVRIHLRDALIYHLRHKTFLAKSA